MDDWIDLVEPWAYGRLAMKDWEYFATTPRALESMARGWMWRREREEDRDAQTWSLLANFNVSKKADLTAPQDIIRHRKLGMSRVKGY